MKAIIKVSSNSIEGLKVEETFQKASTNYKYTTYAVVNFPESKKQSKTWAGKYSGKSGNKKVVIDSNLIKNATFFKIKNTIYAVFPYRKKTRAVCLREMGIAQPQLTLSYFQSQL
jgi:hypothetical protein